MIGSLGLFHNVPCPYYALGVCGRAQCHFSHDAEVHAQSSSTKSSGACRASIASSFTTAPSSTISLGGDDPGVGGEQPTSTVPTSSGPIVSKPVIVKMEPPCSSQNASTVVLPSISDTLASLQTIKFPEELSQIIGMLKKQQQQLQQQQQQKQQPHPKAHIVADGNVAKMMKQIKQEPNVDVDSVGGGVSVAGDVGLSVSSVSHISAGIAPPQSRAVSSIIGTPSKDSPSSISATLTIPPSRDPRRSQAGGYNSGQGCAANDPSGSGGLKSLATLNDFIKGNLRQSVSSGNTYSVPTSAANNYVSSASLPIISNAAEGTISVVSSGANLIDHDDQSANALNPAVSFAADSRWFDSHMKPNQQQQQQQDTDLRPGQHPGFINSSSSGMTSTKSTYGHIGVEFSAASQLLGTIMATEMHRDDYNCPNDFSRSDMSVSTYLGSNVSVAVTSVDQVEPVTATSFGNIPHTGRAILRPGDSRLPGPPGIAIADLKAAALLSSAHRECGKDDVASGLSRTSTAQTGSSPTSTNPFGFINSHGDVDLRRFPCSSSAQPPNLSATENYCKISSLESTVASNSSLPGSPVSSPMVRVMAAGASSSQKLSDSSNLASQSDEYRVSTKLTVTKSLELNRKSGSSSSNDQINDNSKLAGAAFERTSSTEPDESKPGPVAGATVNVTTARVSATESGQSDPKNSISAADGAIINAFDRPGSIDSDFDLNQLTPLVPPGAIVDSGVANNAGSGQPDEIAANLIDSSGNPQSEIAESLAAVNQAIRQLRETMEKHASTGTLPKSDLTKVVANVKQAFVFPAPIPPQMMPLRQIKQELLGDDGIDTIAPQAEPQVNPIPAWTDSFDDSESVVSSAIVPARPDTPPVVPNSQQARVISTEPVSSKPLPKSTSTSNVLSEKYPQPRIRTSDVTLVRGALADPRKTTAPSDKSDSSLTKDSSGNVDDDDDDLYISKSISHRRPKIEYSPNQPDLNTPVLVSGSASEGEEAPESGGYRPTPLKELELIHAAKSKVIPSIDRDAGPSKRVQWEPRTRDVVEPAFSDADDSDDDFTAHSIIADARSNIAIARASVASPEPAPAAKSPVPLSSTQKKLFDALKSMPSKLSAAKLATVDKSAAPLSRKVIPDKIPTKPTVEKNAKERDPKLSISSITSAAKKQSAPSKTVGKQLGLVQSTEPEDDDVDCGVELGKTSDLSNDSVVSTAEIRDEDLFGDDSDHLEEVIVVPKKKSKKSTSKENVPGESKSAGSIEDRAKKLAKAYSSSKAVSGDKQDSISSAKYPTAKFTIRKKPSNPVGMVPKKIKLIDFNDLPTANPDVDMQEDGENNKIRSKDRNTIRSKSGDKSSKHRDGHKSHSQHRHIDSTVVLSGKSLKVPNLSSITVPHKLKKIPGNSESSKSSSVKRDSSSLVVKSKHGHSGSRVAVGEEGKKSRYENHSQAKHSSKSHQQHDAVDSDGDDDVADHDDDYSPPRDLDLPDVLDDFELVSNLPSLTEQKMRREHPSDHNVQPSFMEPAEIDPSSGDRRRLAHPSAATESPGGSGVVFTTTGLAQRSQKPLLMSPQEQLQLRWQSMQSAKQHLLERQRAKKEAYLAGRPLDPDTGPGAKDPSTSSSSQSVRELKGKAWVVPGAIGTLPKGEKRVAHVPVVEPEVLAPVEPEPGPSKPRTPKLPDRPLITDSTSKIPLSIRQRYLNLIIDETLRFIKKPEDAYSRGLEEEKKAFTKASSSKSAYLNAAVMTIKRLRDEKGLKSPTDAFLDPEDRKRKPGISHKAVLDGKPGVVNSYTLHRSHPGFGSADDVGEDFASLLTQYILSSDDLDEHGFPCPDPDVPHGVRFANEEKNKVLPVGSRRRICLRCGKQFSMPDMDLDEDGEPWAEGAKPLFYEPDAMDDAAECLYHWGKAWKTKFARNWDTRYTCCQSDLSVKGCTICNFHVSDEKPSDWLTRGWAQTQEKDEVHGSAGVFALDCEMVYTLAGCEIARVTVVDAKGTTVYDSLIRPGQPIIDTNKRFSGIKPEDMKSAKLSLADVQRHLLRLFSSSSILIGHSLESDLCALKLVHETVIDTSLLFPHRLGLPFKRALKNLATEYLKKIIQDDEGGHDSAEDALTCLELVKWKIRDDNKLNK